MSLIESIAQAIAQVESGGNPNARNYRNNNPGNLRSWGANPIVNGYAQFRTMQAGWDALYAQTRKNIGLGLTLIEFFAGKPGVYAGYAPSSDGNQPLAYAQRVAGQVGISTTIPLDTIGEPPGNPTMPRPAKPKRG